MNWCSAPARLPRAPRILSGSIMRRASGQDWMPRDEIARVRHLGEIRVGILPGGEKVGVLFCSGRGIAGLLAARGNAEERETGSRTFEERLFVTGPGIGPVACGHQRGGFGFANRPNVYGRLAVAESLFLL